MDIFNKLAARTVLPTKNEYTFNDVYFGENGLTSASANHVASLANVLASDVKARLAALRLYQTYIRVIGEEETLVEDVNDTLDEAAELVSLISKANSLAAWLREAVRERDACLQHIKGMTVEDYCKRNGIELMEKPVAPQTPSVNIGDQKAILDAGLNVKDMNRFLELKSTLAVYGELIHADGILTEQKKRLQEIAKSPVTYKESGRDTIITRKEVSARADERLDALYARMQAEYRKLQAEKNGLEAKWANAFDNYQMRLASEHDEAVARYKAELDKYNVQLASVISAMTAWKHDEGERVASLRIVIPNDLKDTYESVTKRYM